MKKYNFAMLGVAGYIAPRHLQAIKETGNTLVAALDPHDSVGILDSYFPNAQFFTEFERFERHVEKLKRKNAGEEVQYVSICSPNYLHDAHIRFALRVGANAICEKPLVLNPWNVDALAEIEHETCKKIYTVLQLRLHPMLIKLKETIRDEKKLKKHTIVLTYITSRGSWYLSSWKGQLDRSGGLATNIGIHFFDLLIWLFGGIQHSEIHFSSDKTICGYLELERARVQWFLSIDSSNLPEEARQKNKKTFRSLTLDGKEIEFSDGFSDLHTQVYRDILAGGGFTLDTVKPSIALAHDIRTAAPVGLKSTSHPLASRLNR